MLAPMMRLLTPSIEKRLAEIPRPDDAPAGHATGLDPDRILVFGSGPASGWGVRTNDLALPGHLARELTRRTGRGSDVDLLAGERITIRDSIAELGRLDLAGYDAVIVTLGVADALGFTDPAHWKHHMDALLCSLASRMSRSAQILVAGIQPIRSITVYNAWWGDLADRRAQHFNRISETLASTHERTQFLALPGERLPKRRHTAPEMYQTWAALMAGRLAGVLSGSDAGGHVSGRDRPAELGSAREHRRMQRPEDARQNALDQLELVGSEPTSNLQRIVQMTQIAFGTEAAAINLIDHDQQWVHAKAGPDVHSSTRAESFCAVTIKDPNGLVVPNASLDWEFAQNPIVRAGRVGFYAGYPIESPDGQRIGALCVTDPQPRRFSGSDRSALRDLALLVQQELWNQWNAAQIAERQTSAPPPAPPRTRIPPVPTGRSTAPEQPAR
ncbi:GAF domain-containing protein [Naasia lichenicola]|uniref:GAF domain-containing protein n=1 Tax=Naasia lichenicola TaxID=2565933 RepID=A0A4S4FR19_9MICO|nr:GAF domain-containing protein [Naasia lichenicola]THG31866.1 GAF domain-containing protein [Naasia lichenicola]